MEPKDKLNSTKRYIALTLAVIILIVVSMFAINSLTQSDDSIAPATNNEATSNESATVDENTESYISYEATTNGSALDQLQAVNDTVVVKESELGKFVDAINGLIGGTDGKYWSFYVDGKLAEVGADTYELNGGELIEWKFQKL